MRFRLPSPHASLAAGLLAAGLLSDVDAQTRRPPGAAPRPLAATKPAKAEKVPETRILMELLTGKEGVGLKAQEWARTLEELKVECRIRQGRAGDELDIEERSVSTSLREVTLIGRLERDGSLTFVGKRFAESDVVKLREWLTELRTYGAQGSPTGKPLWGLNDDQFEAVFKALADDVSGEFAGASLGEALDAAAPTLLPLTWTSNADKARSRLPASWQVRQEVGGLTRGTALAILLNQAGLGFRPRRTPNGDLELAVVSLGETTDVWPIGWPLEQKGPEAAPKLFKLVNIELNDEPLADVLDVLPKFLDMPVFVDDDGLRRENIDLRQLTVSHPAKQATWSQALKGITYGAKLRREVWMDEKSRPFLWITPLKSAKRDGAW